VHSQSYYRRSIVEGRILVSGRRVSPQHVIRSGDELTHTVHRHEPAAAVAPASGPVIVITSEKDDVISVDKPSTLPVHPCGGYHHNSLFEVMGDILPRLRGSLHTVHRLDRLTSGLTIVAKNKVAASRLAKEISDRRCEKYYLARVRGRFPLEADAKGKRVVVGTDVDVPCVPCVLGEWTGDRKKGEDKSAMKGAALGFWIGNASGEPSDVSLADLAGSNLGIDDYLSPDTVVDSTADPSAPPSPPWLHLACPCRIAEHKRGVCEAGDFSSRVPSEAPGVRPAQTSFAFLCYDAATDTSMVLCRPQTGRTHQIRLHLQHLGHSIANDHNYGGTAFHGDPEAAAEAAAAEKEMDALDRAAAADSGREVGCRPVGATSTDGPATETEVGTAGALPRGDNESMVEFVQRTCVWCARGGGDRERAVLEFLSRSRGCWLHCYMYKVGGGVYRAGLPEWFFGRKKGGVGTVAANGNLAAQRKVVSKVIASGEGL